MSNVTYKLKYFNFRGRAEAIRILFKLANQNFEDIRFELSEWSALKQTFIFHQLPVLEVCEDSKTTVIAQSNSILRFVADRLGLSGKDDLERAKCDMINEQIISVFENLVNIYRMKDGDEKQKALDSTISEQVPNGYKLIQNFLDESGFLVGDKITYADIVLVLSYDWLRDRKDEVLAKLPGLKKHYEKIMSIPLISQHIEENKHVRLTILFE
ncbi:unnamed protein product [Brachionus calyciflorus]|uniref:Uncharacterized protein n=1 Tax=Brachionus calyciflorus TaxID=104777 RepID=A0A814FW71_9BILA|nr:unnamed protein product [Brachionus calyciflorus]